ncbi:hypothetical protein AAV94_06200 [Lampropedia cohaerens]|uniref:Pseudouridine synthase n=1 Tax=Lampropedia cohaerens TaxID=1610491 RepID=A0A0U1Q0G0_9BURK|nr:RluA family pseudouridine synthase [Lampropedia cohaerens]KKW68247.1 hypothetical protein AAV94_06200 [Lampropedia cohaerens]
MPDLSSLSSALDDSTEELEAVAEQRHGPIGEHLHGERLDKAVHDLAPEFSRSYLQGLIRRGLVRLDDQVVIKPAYKVSAGQLLAVGLQPSAQSQAFLPQPMALDVRYEDEDVLVVNKPAGLVVHPAAGNWSGTLLNGLLARSPVFATLPRAGIVHRLDKDTSGLMVVGKSLPAIKNLVEQIASREVSRRYLAIARRAPRAAWPWAQEGSSIDVDAAIGRDPHNRLRMAVLADTAPGAKLARTTITLLARQEDWVLLHCALHTGRTHQIRVHARQLGFPLVGDAVYGGAAYPGLARQALHAWKLAFRHPITGDPIEVLSDAPADLQTICDALGLRLP